MFNASETSSMMTSEVQPRNYERWEVCISNRIDINSYFGYCRALFLEDKSKFVVIKARGLAIENALKVVQLVKENLQGVSSCTKLGLQFTQDRPRNLAYRNATNQSEFFKTPQGKWKRHIEHGPGREKEVENL